jgi:hypothetical protein
LLDVWGDDVLGVDYRAVVIDDAEFAQLLRRREDSAGVAVFVLDVQLAPLRESHERIGAAAFGIGQPQRGLLAERLDVQGRAAADVGDALGQLGRARAGVGATDVDVPLLGRGQLGAARRADGRHRPLALAPVAQRPHGAENLGNDVAGLSHDDDVAYEHALARDLRGVVKRRLRDGRPGDRHGLHDGEGGDAPRAPHLHLDVEQPRLDLLRRILVGHGPPGHARRGPQVLLFGARVYFEDGAVDAVNEIRSQIGVLADESFDVVPA